LIVNEEIGPAFADYKSDAKITTHNFYSPDTGSKNYLLINKIMDN